MNYPPARAALLMQLVIYAAEMQKGHKGALVRTVLADWNSGGSKSIFGRIRGALEQDSQVLLCKICP